MPNKNIHKPKTNCADTFLIAKTPIYSLIVSMKSRILISYISRRSSKTQTFLHRSISFTPTAYLWQYPFTNPATATPTARGCASVIPVSYTMLLSKLLTLLFVTMKCFTTTMMRSGLKRRTTTTLWDIVHVSLSVPFSKCWQCYFLS